MVSKDSSSPGNGCNCVSGVGDECDAAIAIAQLKIKIIEKETVLEKICIIT